MRGIVVLFFLIASIGNLFSQNTPTLKFYVTPSVSAKIIESRGEYIRQYLQKETGITISFKLLNDYEDMVSYFGDGTSCFAIMNSQTYILVNKMYGAQAKLRLVRYGSSVYFGMIVVHANSAIKDIKDLTGKSIAYTDELSTSGYLYPKKMLEREKVVLGKTQFAKQHEEVIKRVYEGKVDAGAAFYSPAAANGEIHDARARVKHKLPDVEKVVSVLKITEPIPNDPIVFSKGFDKAAANKLYLAFVKLSSDAFGRKVLKELFDAEGFVESRDADYNSLRKVMGTSK